MIEEWSNARPVPGSVQVIQYTGDNLDEINTVANVKPGRPEQGPVATCPDAFVTLQPGDFVVFVRWSPGSAGTTLVYTNADELRADWQLSTTAGSAPTGGGWVEVNPLKKPTYRAVKWTGDNLSEIQSVTSVKAADEFGTISGLVTGMARPGDWIIIEPITGLAFSENERSFETRWKIDEWTPEEWALARAAVQKHRDQ